MEISCIKAENFGAMCEFRCSWLAVASFMAISIVKTHTNITKAEQISAKISLLKRWRGGPNESAVVWPSGCDQLQCKQ